MLHSLFQTVLLSLGTAVNSINLEPKHLNTDDFNLTQTYRKTWNKDGQTAYWPDNNNTWNTGVYNYFYGYDQRSYMQVENMRVNNWVGNDINMQQNTYNRWSMLTNSLYDVTAIKLNLQNASIPNNDTTVAFTTDLQLRDYQNWDASAYTSAAMEVDIYYGSNARWVETWDRFNEETDVTNGSWTSGNVEWPRDLENLIIQGSYSFNFNHEHSAQHYDWNEQAPEFTFEIPVKLLANSINIMLIYIKMTMDVPQSSNNAEIYGYDENTYHGWLDMYRTEMNLSYQVITDNPTEVVDIPGLMFNILTMPFAFISQAFNLTLFPGTLWEINIANLFLAVIGILIFMWIILHLILKK